MNCCFLSYFIIKPQLRVPVRLLFVVVSYLISSSNHNFIRNSIGPPFVVSYLISSSNHNYIRVGSPSRQLFLILFHHQTTTDRQGIPRRQRLFLILFHHQTTTGSPHFSFLSPVVSYLISSSNHNS